MIPHRDLTYREVDVLMLVALGKSNAQIAGLLGLTVNTVKTHLKRVAEVLGTRDRSNALATAIALGFVRVGYDRRRGLLVSDGEPVRFDEAAPGLAVAA